MKYEYFFRVSVVATLVLIPLILLLNPSDTNPMRVVTGLFGLFLLFAPIFEVVFKYRGVSRLWIFPLLIFPFFATYPYFYMTRIYKSKGKRTIDGGLE